MSGFGAKIKLSVDTSNKAQFNKQINDMVETLDIGKKIVISKENLESLKTQIRTGLGKAGIPVDATINKIHSTGAINKFKKQLNMNVTVKKIDCSEAVKDMRQQLQTMINSLSIRNGVSITGLIDPTGVGTIGTELDGVAEAAKRGQAEITRMAGQLSTLKTIMQSLASSYKTVLPGGKNAMEAAELTAITARYTALQTEIAEINALQKEGKVVSAERIAALQDEALAIAEIIASKERLRIAEIEANKAAEKARKDAEKGDKSRILSTEEQIKAIKKVSALLKKVTDAQEKWSKAKYVAPGDYAKLDDQREGLEALLLVLRSGNVTVQAFEDSFNSLNGEFNNTSAIIKLLGGDTQTFVGKMGSLITKFSKWLTISQIITTLYRAMKQMVGVVIDVDTAMTELRKVTDNTETTYIKFLDNAAKRAKALGATLSDTVTATADFARLGYNLGEASSLADAALVYKNVGNGIEDIATASESVIATMQAFSVDAADAMNIVDKFNAVGNKFAISSGGIGDALLRSAAAMRAANNTLDETIALTAAANTIVQDPEKVGTTLKTVSMFLRAAKTEAEEAGESTDGMANSVSELREEILKLTGNKVDIQIDENTFKSTYQILKELSGVWSELTDISQANILEMVGGKRNSNVVAAILENFTIADEALTVSENSMGSALAENEKFLDSIQGKITEFKAAFQELASTLIDSSLVKAVVEFGTTILEFLNSLAIGIEKIGGAKVVLTALAGSLMSTGAKAYGALKQFRESVVGAEDVTDTLIDAFNTVSGGLDDIEVDDFTNRISQLRGILSSTAGGFGKLGLAIAGVTAVITVAMIAVEAHKRKIREQHDAAVEAVASYREITKNTDEYKNRIHELKRALDSGTLSEKEAYEAKTELLSIQDSLIECFGSEAESINLLAMSADSATIAIDGLTAAMANASLNKHVDAINAAIDAIESEQTFFSGTLDWKIVDENTITKINDIVSKYEGASLRFEKTGDMFNSGWAILDINANPEDAQEVLNGLTTDFRELKAELEREGIDFDSIFPDYDSFISGLSGSIQRIEDIFSEHGEIYNQQIQWKIIANDDYQSIFAEMENASATLNEAISEGNEDSIRAAFDTVDALRAKLAEIDFGEDSSVYKFLDELLLEIESTHPVVRVALKLEDDIESGAAYASSLQKAIQAFVNEEGKFDLYAAKNAQLDYEARDFYNPADLSDAEKAYASLLSVMTLVGSTSIDEFAAAMEYAGLITIDAGEKIDTGAKLIRQSYEMVSKSVAATSTVIRETNGIFLEGNHITEEAYNALVELAGGEDKLADCIDKSNGYLIKNAELLGQIATKAFDATEDNLKLAKSHEMIDYYDLTHTMKELLSVEGEYNDETRKLTENILSQLSAIDRQITRYNILEQQLNGATKAFDDLAAAQAFDTETDYTDDMSGMLDALLKAYENHEFGTETFRTAFEGIVPEDVYSQFEDVGDQIDAGWNYINEMLAKGYFSYDEGNISIDYDNVKNFVEKALQTELDDGTTVFTGTIDDFKLNESITSIEQLADALGITTEMAFALGTAINKYDAENADFLTGLAAETLEGKLHLQTKELAELLEKKNDLLKSGEFSGDIAEELTRQIDEARGALDNLSLEALGKVEFHMDIDEQIKSAEKEADTLLIKLKKLEEAGIGEGNLNYDTLLQSYREQLDKIGSLFQEKFETGELSEFEVQVALEVVGADLEQAKAELSKFATYNEETLTWEIRPHMDQAGFDAALAQVQKLEEQKAEIEAYIGLEEDDVLTQFNELVVELDGRTITISANTGTAYRNLKNVADMLSNITSKTVTMTVNTTGTGTVSSGGYRYDIDSKTYRDSAGNIVPGPSRFAGNAYIRGRWGALSFEKNALVGELGTELIVDPSTGIYYTVGENGAEFVDIPKGAIIFNHRQTEGLLKNKRINSRGKAYANGRSGSYARDEYLKKYNVEQTTTTALNNHGFIDTDYSIGSVTGGGSTVSGTGGSASTAANSAGSGEDAESWFERMYKYHQHLLEMDAENVKDYLNWLDKAYKDAYARGEIDLDDYYQYEAEVYQGLQDLFKDYLNDREHEISMRENYEGESDKIIAIYEGLIKDVTREILAARDAGLDDTDEYIQELQNKYQDYVNAIKDIQEEAHEDAKDAVNELIEYRIDMIKQGLEDEKDALDKQLDYLKRFVDKQKELLQGQKDDKDYQKEQGEKRDNVTDLENELKMLEKDDSAWAQKRKLELEEELKIAREELTEFEEDHALNKVLDTLDKVYESQEDLFQKEIDLIDEKLNDPEALYNQALNDIRNNTGGLYQEMLEYNRKHGTGNDEDPTDVYEEAYKALLEYKDIYGENYKDIILPNSTGYTPPEGSWDTDVNSGTNPDNYRPPTSLPTDDYLTPSAPVVQAPSLTRGSYVEVKDGAKWYENSFGGGAWGWASGGTIQYINEGGSHPYNINGAGWIRKEDIVGYASGTDNATPGIHEINEEGEEAFFTSSDGKQYKLFRGGDKVFNTPAADFLYNFANAGSKGFIDMIVDAVTAGASALGEVKRIVNDIRMGDIIIEGNADEQTISEIRRAQRESVDFMLKEFNRLKR